MTRDNAGTIAQICRRLDGLPLAIELAAALEDIGGTLYFGDRFEHAKTLASLHATLPDDVFAAAFERGRAMTLEQAVEYALEQGEV